MSKFWCFSVSYPYGEGGAERSRDLAVWYPEAIFGHQRHSVFLVHDETVFRANSVGSRTLRPQFPSPKVKVLRSWLQTSCQPTITGGSSLVTRREGVPPCRYPPWRTPFYEQRYTCTKVNITTPTMIISSSSATSQLTSSGRIPRSLHGRCLWIPPNLVGRDSLGSSRG